MSHWGSDVKEQFGKMVEEGRNLRVSTVSKLIALKLEGWKPFEELGHEYTDHCATVDNPMNFREFFVQTTFYNGGGDWKTYKALQEALGEKPALDSYLTLRRDSRTTTVQKKLKVMHDAVEKVLAEAAKDKEVNQFSVNKDYPTLSKVFYDQVFKYKDAENPYLKPEDKKTTTTAPKTDANKKKTGE